MMLLPRQVAILELLSKTQYLTFRNVMEQGIFEVEITARKNIRALVSGGFINEHTFGLQVGVGRLPNLYGLTPKGANYLITEEHYPEAQIKISKSNRGEMKAPRDFYHRTGTIDTLLALYKALESRSIRTIQTELYFRQHGLHQPKRTQIVLENGRLEPDAIIQFEDENKKPRLFLIEFYEDSEQVERIRRALVRHAEALISGAPSIALNLNVGHSVLLVFRYEHTAKAVMRYLHQDPLFQAMQNRFLSITLEALKQDALTQWATPNQQKTPLF